MTSSRLGYDNQGRSICVDTGGRRWLVLGNLVYSTVTGDLVLFGWLGTSGRPPTSREMATARPPYDSASAKRARQPRQEIPDDLLDERQALEACRREQEREPVHLVSRVPNPCPNPRETVGLPTSQTTPKPSRKASSHQPPATPTSRLPTPHTLTTSA